MLRKFVIIVKELRLINKISKVEIRNLMYRDEIEVMTSVCEYQKMYFGLQVF